MTLESLLFEDEENNTRQVDVNNVLNGNVSFSIFVSSCALNTTASNTTTHGTSSATQSAPLSHSHSNPTSSAPAPASTTYTLNIPVSGSLLNRKDGDHSNNQNHGGSNSYSNIVSMSVGSSFSSGLWPPESPSSSFFASSTLTMYDDEDISLPTNEDL